MLALTLSAAADADSEQRLKQTKQCPGCELINADLTGAQLEGANLQDANMSGATVYGGNLSNANLTNANLAGANLNGTNLRGARGANLSTALTNERTTCPNGTTGPCN